MFPAFSVENGLVFRGTKLLYKSWYSWYDGGDGQKVYRFKRYLGGKMDSKE